MQPIFWIIAAPSCVGKTTFLKENSRLAEITGLKSPPRILSPMGNRIFEIANGTEPIYYHCCLSFGSSFKGHADIQMQQKAIILVSTKDTMMARSVIRLNAFKEGKNEARPPMRSHITKEAWRHIYERHIAELEEMDIPYILINTEKPEYPIITKKELSVLLEGEEAMATKEEVQAVIDKFPPGRYHRVNLPYGLHTKGLDRTPTRNIILGDSLKGKTLLDVGCAYGYMSFEAESLGATVTALDTKPERIAQAKVFAKLRGSKINFKLGNVLDQELGEYDYILLLNVIHHLKEKATDVLDFLVPKAKEKFCLESPYLKHLGMSPENALKQYFNNVETFPSSLDKTRQIVVATIK